MPRLPAIRPSSGPNRTPTRTQGERPSTFGQADSAIQSLSNTVQAAIVKHERQREANALYAAETEAQSKLAEVKRQALEDPASAVNTYTNQSQAVRDEVLAGIDDNRVREEFQLRYDRDHARGLAVVRNRSIKALRQENIAAATSQAEDIAVNSAELGGKARETMIDEGMAAYKRLLDTGDIDQAEFEDKALEFKARADDQRARYLIRNGELDAATSLIGQSDALDETAKLTLQNSVDVRKRREQAKTEQAARDAERAILTPGGFVPEGTESLVNALKGTEAGDALEQAIADRQLIDETVRKPLAEQFAVVTRLRREAREARDPVQLQTAKNVAKAVKNSFDMADDDPLAYAASVGHVDLDPIFDDSGQLDTEAVHDRLLAAREATRKTGKRTLPFTQPEISALNKTMTEGEASQAVLTMQELATALPPSTHFQVANALLPENRSTAVAFGLAKDQPRMAAAVLEGRDILAQDNSLVELPSAADLQDAAATVYEDMFAGQPGTFDAHIQAAKQLYAKRAADSGAFSYDKGGFKQA
ncbi:MAG TPA: hypothetical protein VKA19_07700, partial [Alphaproteobacteria bacterium]|nr:hypothetical protein [Alphaproteobacteria bacterium]